MGKADFEMLDALKRIHEATHPSTTEVDRLRKMVADRDATIAELRQSRAFYRDNYLKAKAAYEKAVGKA